MSKRKDIAILIQEGQKIVTKDSRADIKVSDLVKIDKLAGSSRTNLALMAYHAGIAAGYKIRKREEAAKRKQAAKRSAKRSAQKRRELLLEMAHELNFTPYEERLALELAQLEKPFLLKAEVKNRGMESDEGRISEQDGKESAV